jgi:hypothetical protein
MVIDWRGEVVVDGEVVKLVRIKLGQLFDRMPNLTMILHRAREVGLVQCPEAVAEKLSSLFRERPWEWELPTKIAMLPLVGGGDHVGAYGVSFHSGELSTYGAEDSLGFGDPGTKFLFAVPNEQARWYQAEIVRPLPKLTAVIPGCIMIG